VSAIPGYILANDHKMLSQEERIALLKRLERLVETPGTSPELRASTFCSMRLLSNVIAYQYRKSGRPDTPFRIYAH
jgi:hypothetical protein